MIPLVDLILMILILYDDVEIVYAGDDGDDDNDDGDYL